MRYSFNLKKTIYIALALFISIWVVQCATGYCADEHKYLTDDEYIRAAFYQKHERAGRHDIRVDIDFEGASSVEEYLENHPNCCTVSRTDLLHSRHRLFYLGDAEVYMVYKKSKVRNNEPPYYEEYVVLTACGSVIRRYGMEMDEKSYKQHLIFSKRS